MRGKPFPGCSLAQHDQWKFGSWPPTKRISRWIKIIDTYLLVFVCHYSAFTVSSLFIQVWITQLWTVCGLDSSCQLQVHGTTDLYLFRTRNPRGPVTRTSYGYFLLGAWQVLELCTNKSTKNDKTLKRNLRKRLQKELQHVLHGSNGACLFSLIFGFVVIRSLYDTFLSKPNFTSDKLKFFAISRMQI